MREPALYRYTEHAAPATPDDLRKTIARWTGGALSPRERWWNWTIVAHDDAGTMRPLGHVQLTFTLAGDVLLAYMLDPTMQGRGLATAAVRLAVTHLQEATAATTLVAFIDGGNERSLALAERAGLRRTREHDGTLTPDEFRYELHFARTTDIRAAMPTEHVLLRAYFRAMSEEIGTGGNSLAADWECRYDESIERLDRDAVHLAFVALRDGTVRGCIHMHDYRPLVPAIVERRTAYLWGLYVEPAARASGLARSLMERCLNEARERGCDRVMLHGSKAARSLHTALGFKPSTEMLLSLEPE